MSLGPYIAKKDKTINYRGNKIFPPAKNILNKKIPYKQIALRTKDFYKNPRWSHIAKINHQINLSANNYFDHLGAKFTLLPLVTRMISSPGALYGKEAISYTTDTCPIKLNWFDLEKSAFLSESSQIYLELALIQQNIDQVYSIYNSFRKEKADATHLCEFHHIEYEGKVDQKKNKKIIFDFVKKMLDDLLKNNEKDFSFFLENKRLTQLEKLTKKRYWIEITLKEALNLLYRDTKNSKYKKFTMKFFGSWEEIRLTEILGGIAVINEFPLLEVPFYHAEISGKKPKVADGSDFIWPGYREFIGSGHRVQNTEELEKKAKIFDLPMKDYKPYLASRKIPNYKETSGFGLGWERFLQGFLEMPFIYSIAHFPRCHKILMP